MDVQARQPPPQHQGVLNRFVTACWADERVVAATLYGSHARGTADAYSDLDLGVITTDAAYEDFVASRDAFARLLGEVLFLEDFGSPVTVFVMLADGTDAELAIGRAGQFSHIHDAPYQVLLDKQQILAGATFAQDAPARPEQTETLRRLIYGFWHDWAHFITAMGRGQLWWGYGQLEILRRMCIDLARLHHNFLDADVGAETYFKLEHVLPVEQLSPLQPTFCPQEPEAMLHAAHAILCFYQDLAPSLAQAHGIPYPEALAGIGWKRLEKLGQGK
jgi:predicted nucleotidyltransferase